MKTTKMLTILVLASAIMVWPAEVSEAAEMGTAFTYQGRLIDANDVADGLYDFQFSLYDVNVGGAAVANDVNVHDMDVIDGYFTVELDFGSDVFDGNAVWLEIGVRPGELNDSNAYTTLSPRQEVTPVPYALQTRGIFVDNGGNVGIGTTSPSFKLDVEGSARFWNSTGDRSGVQIGTTSGSGTAIEGIASDGNLTQDMWINYQSSGKVILAYGGGNVGIGLADPSEALDVDGTARLRGISAQAGATYVHVDGNGKLWKITSSKKYKTNIRELNSDPMAVLELRPVKYQCRISGKEDVGLIAEEVEQVTRDLVIHNDDGSPEAVKYDRVALYLLQVVKAQQGSIAALEERVESLESTTELGQLRGAKEVQQ